MVGILADLEVDKQAHRLADIFLELAEKDDEDDVHYLNQRGMETLSSQLAGVPVFLRKVVIYEMYKDLEAKGVDMELTQILEPIQ